MTLCQNCQKRNKCKAICKTVKKIITGRGKTASRKPKTYPMDFSYIEDSHNTLNSFQKHVLNTIEKFSPDISEQLIAKLSIQKAISKTLNNKEKQVIKYFIETYGQVEIAKAIGITQPRVNFILNRSFRKLKNFIERL